MDRRRQVRGTTGDASSTIEVAKTRVTALSTCLQLVQLHQLQGFARERTHLGTGLGTLHIPSRFAVARLLGQRYKGTRDGREIIVPPDVVARMP